MDKLDGKVAFVTGLARVSEAIRWLVADSGRHVTGTAVPIDAGFALR